MPSDTALYSLSIARGARDISLLPVSEEAGLYNSALCVSYSFGTTRRKTSALTRARRRTTQQYCTRATAGDRR